MRDVHILKKHIDIPLLKTQRNVLVKEGKSEGIVSLLDHILDVSEGFKPGDIKAINGMEESNPFRRNYLFSKEDLNRCRLTSGWRWRLIFKPMLHQITSDGYGVHFKIRDDEIFIFEIEEM